MTSTDRVHGFAVSMSVTMLVISCGVASRVAAPASGPVASKPARVVSRAALPWQPLNPARGDKSPRAANLWGDLRKEEATGFLVQFVDGFSSPPHIHNITYRGVVIEGLIHNDDPTAEELWMGPGSHWVQPAGDVHITSAKGGIGLAYIEIESGPYLVRPPEQAFDSTDKPVNVVAASVGWNKHGEGFETVEPWGAAADGGARRVLVRLPVGFSGSIFSADPIHAVVIRGALTLVDVVGASDALEAGSFFEADSLSEQLRCASSQPCVLYYRARGRVRIAAQPS